MNTINSQDIQEKLDHWLKKVTELRPATRTGIYNESEWMISTGDIVGAYQETDLKIADDLKRMGGYVSDEAIEKLLQSPANALAALSNMVMNAVGYDPQAADDDDTPANYAEYIKLMRQNPLIGLKSEEGRHVKYKESDYDSLIDNVVLLFDSLSDIDATKLKASATSLLEILHSDSSAKVTSSKFAQDVIQSENKEDVLFNMNTSYMEFTRDKNGKCKPLSRFKSEIQVQSLVFKFDTGNFNKEMAKNILEATENNLKDWIDKVKTKAKG